jgi:acylphosphatase
MVGFRAWTQSHANNMGLCGWVRNLHDGRVEILAQGDSGQLEAFKKLIRQGPPLGRVDSLECNWIDYDQDYKRFELYH